MASYAELQSLRSDSALGNKVQIAIIVKAHGILNEVTPGANRKAWAEEALANPASKLVQLFNYVLAENKDVTLPLSPSDSAIQTNIDAAVDQIVPSGA